MGQIFVNTLAIDPQTPTIVYAGTSMGVFKSTDGGGIWISMGLNCGSYTCEVFALAIDPMAPTTLYEGTDCCGVFRSMDGAESWTAMVNGLMALDVRALVLVPQTSGTLSAGTLLSVSRGTNEGGRLGAMISGVTSQFFQIRAAFALESSDPTILYAGTNGGGVFKSRDGGGNWIVLNAGLTNLNVHALAVDPSTPTRVYAGTDGGSFVFTTSSVSTDGDHDGGNCFIATAAYGSPLAPEVARLRAFRDRYLLSNAPGRILAGLYARLSPPLAHALARSEVARAVIRVLLRPLIWWAGLMLAAPVAGTAMALSVLVFIVGLFLGLVRTRRVNIRR